MTEQEYDEKVAPLLLQACKEAEKVGGTVLCFAEWGEHHDNGRTVVMRDASAHARLVDLAMKCKGNLDAFAIALVKAHHEGTLDLSQTIFIRQMAAVGR